MIKGIGNIPLKLTTLHQAFNVSDMHGTVFARQSLSLSSCVCPVHPFLSAMQSVVSLFVSLAGLFWATEA